MNSLQWLEQITNNTAPTSAARRAGLNASTMARQIKGGELSAETVVAIARTYHAPVLPGLVACGLLTEDEANTRAALGILLTDATDEQLLRELLRRVDTDGKLNHPTLTQPLDDTHPALTQEEPHA